MFPKGANATACRSPKQTLTEKYLVELKLGLMKNTSILPNMSQLGERHYDIEEQDSQEDSCVVEMKVAQRYILEGRRGRRASLLFGTTHIAHVGEE